MAVNFNNFASGASLAETDQLVGFANTSAGGERKWTLSSLRTSLFTGAASSISSSNLTASMALVSDANGKVATSSTVSSTELGYLDGVTSSIQTQLNGKQATITGAATTIISSNLTPSVVLVSDSNGKVASSSVTSTELNYITTLTSDVQVQLNNRVLKSGDTMTGFLTLNANPTQNLHAATKQYVDTILGGKQDAITGAATTITASNLTASMALVSDANGKVAVSPNISSTELSYLDGVTSSIQSQLNAKQATITGAASTIASSNLAASRALVSDANGKVAISNVTATELNYLTGLTSNIQTQLTVINTRKAVKFPNKNNWTGNDSHHVTSLFISDDKRLYGSGHANGYYFGKGSYNYNVVSRGFKDMTPTDMLAGEHVTEVYTSKYSLYVLTNLGNLYSTGYNGYGQLGRNGTTNDFYWGRINISNVTWFSVRNSCTAYQHCLAISGGRLYSWGYNGYYQLGDGTATSRSTPTLINNGSITNLTITKAYACGDDYTSYSYTFVIDSNRDLHFVGNNGLGQAGNGNTTQQTNFIKIGVKADHVSSKAWNSGGTTYILDNKTLYVAGANHYGQLGVGNTTHRYTFALTNPALTTVEEIFTGNYHNGTAIARLTNGTIRTWGRNTNGPTGNGNQTDVTTPYNPGLNGIVKVFITGSQDSPELYALTSNGECYVSGYNGHGQKGIGNTTNNFLFSRMLKDSNNIQFKDITGWSDGSNGNGTNLLDQYGELYAVGYTNWGAGGHSQEDDSWCYVPERATIK